MNKYIQNLINEQFNIGGMNLNNTAKHSGNIFNKQIIDPYKIYEKILHDRKNVTREEFDFMNGLTGVINVHYADTLRHIILFYGINNKNDSLNWANVSDIKNMSYLFENAKFNGDISKWDVSNVTNMTSMFNDSDFNQDISEWDVSNVKNMTCMFQFSVFDKDINDWDVHNVTDMYGMFAYSKFNKDISKWDIRNVTDMNCMFLHSSFNQDVSNWDMSGKLHKRMFDECNIKEEYMPKSK